MSESVISLLYPSFQLLHDLGATLYAGPMIAGTALLASSLLGGRLALPSALGTFRAWGAGFGLALGGWVLGLLGLHYLQAGAFRWAWSSDWERWTLVRHLVFLALWIWNMRIEIWSLEPLRRLDRAPSTPDPGAWRAASLRLLRDLVLQSLLLLAYLALGSFEPL